VNADSDIARLLNDSVDRQLGPRRSAPWFGSPSAAPARAKRRRFAPLLAAASVIILAGGIYAVAQTSNRHEPAGPVVVTTSASSSPALTASPATTAPTTPTAVTPTSIVASVTSDPKIIRFDGVGQLKLGMTAAQLAALGYPNGSTLTSGCRQYSKGAVPFVLYSPALDAVVKVDLLSDASYKTVEGIAVGSSLTAVRTAYAGHPIEEHLDGSFGQGSSGVVVGGSGGYLGFGITNGVVSGITIGDTAHVTGTEASC
jgi:hypothetical protein